MITDVCLKAFVVSNSLKVSDKARKSTRLHASLTPEDTLESITLFVLLGTLGEDILCSCVDAVSVKIMGLEKAGPELLLRHVMRHIFTILLLHCKYNASSYK